MIVLIATYLLFATLGLLAANVWTKSRDWKPYDDPEVLHILAFLFWPIFLVLALFLLLLEGIDMVSDKIVDRIQK